MVDQILELQNARGTNAKVDVIQKYKDDWYFRTLLYYALNPVMSYNLSENTLRKKAENLWQYASFDDIFECCDFLSRLRGIDDATILQVKEFLYERCSEQEREVYIKLLSKTLRLGVTAKTVNKVIPGAIPEWEVQQSFPIDSYPIPGGTEFWLTQKLNGVRATFYNGSMISRSGQTYNGLDHIINSKAGEWATENGMVLDGELILGVKGELSDNESFRITTGILNSETENKIQICFTIFDVIPVTDFDSARPTMTYRTRRALLDENESVLNTEYTSVLPVLYHGTDQSQIWTLLDQMEEEDKEGLMLNTDVPYLRTRHRGILKVKRFYSMDLQIIRCEEGNGRIRGKIGALVVEFQGNEVKVGSGFTDEQRDTFWQNRDEIAGMYCEVKYKEISFDKSTGLRSLQFPVFIRLRKDKTEESYG